MLLAGLLTSVIAGIVAFAVTLFVRRNALRLGVIANPNERSSHTAPTPSGGGLGIVAGGTIGGLFVAWFMPWPTLVVVTAALAMAAIGFVDDRRPLPAWLRLVAQLLLAGVVVSVPDPLPLAQGFGITQPLLLFPLLVLAAVYWTNIFNFMDGIDGLAASQALFMFAAAVLLMLQSQATPETLLVWWLAAIAAACLAFLLLNWPPAKIFMGDAGSTYLGFMLAYTAFATIAAGWLTLWQWLIIGALFIADATLTLLRRLLRREPILKAHRLHAYQHLSRRWKGHQPVTLLYIAVNVVGLLPLAWWAGAAPEFGAIAAALAYVPVLAGLAFAGAGAPEAPGR